MISTLANPLDFVSLIVNAIIVANQEYFYLVSTVRRRHADIDR